MEPTIQNIKDPNILRESIGDAAKELFSYYGFKKTAMDDIAQKARVAKGTIYNYFRNKDDLIRYVMRKEGETLISKIKEGLLSQKTPQLKFREMIIIKIKFIKELRLLFALTHKTALEILPIPVEIIPVVQPELKEIAGQEIDIIKEILEEGVKNSVFRPINISETAKIMRLAMKGFELKWGIEMDSEKATAELDNILDIMLKGLEIR